MFVRTRKESTPPGFVPLFMKVDEKRYVLRMIVRINFVKIIVLSEIHSMFIQTEDPTRITIL